MNAQKVQVKGFLRLGLVNVRNGEEHITPWIPNAITENGFDNYIVGAIGAIAGSKQVSHLQVATQTDAPVSTQTSASGEFEAREAVSNSLVGNGTLQATCSFNTDEANASELGAVALYNTSSGGTAGSIATFATSQKTTDQVLNITYQWRFS
jgi:hypothetical protein